MKALIIWLTIISFIGCSDKKSQNTITKTTPQVKIDSTKKGIVGKPGYTLEIITRFDATVRKRETKYWYSNTKVFQRIEYFDSLGRKYKQSDIDFYKDEVSHTYVWYDTTKDMISNLWIARIDSTFRSNESLKEYKQWYLNTELTEYYNTKSKVYKKHLSSSELMYSYFQEGNEFYKQRSDIPLEYAEWMQTSKTDFGQSIKLFYDSKIMAQIRFKKLYNKELD